MYMCVSLSVPLIGTRHTHTTDIQAYFIYADTNSHADSVCLYQRIKQKYQNVYILKMNFPVFRYLGVRTQVIFPRLLKVKS